MTTSATFETASLAAAINKAAAIAPNTGHAFDKAAGLVMEVDTAGDIIVIKSTDTEAYYMEWLSPLETRGPSAVWRLPSKMVAGVVGSLPIGSGKTVTFTQEANTLHITSAKTRGKFQLITYDKYYPEWEPFDTEDMATVPAFGAQLKRVAWAASTSNDPPLTGVYMDGKSMMATDKYRIATVSLEFECERPISVPPMAVSAILKDKGDVKLKIADTQLYIMPDDHTQLRATVCGMEYPNLERLMVSYPEMVQISRDELVECINRSKHVIGSDRSPLLKMWFGREEVAVAVIQETDGLIDVVDVPGFCTHENRYQLGFGHANIVAALLASPNDMVEISYDPNNKKGRSIHIAGGCGYEAWVATRRTTGAVSE